MSCTLASQGATDPDVEEIVRFGLASVQASAAMFYWVEEGRNIADPQFTGINPYFFTEYSRKMGAYDPLGVTKMVAKSVNVAQLAAVPLEQERGAKNYRDFLGHYGVTDVVDLLFWSGGIPVAGLGLMKRPGDPPVSAGQIQTAFALQRFIEHNLRRHERLTRLRRRHWLSQNFLLTAREIGVAELAAEGWTNAGIAQQLNISLPTVKTHLLRALAKTECRNRTQLGMRIAEADR